MRHAALVLLLSALAGGGCYPMRSLSAVDTPENAHPDLLSRLKLLAKIVSSRSDVPHHLQRHARRMSTLSLAELHDHPDHSYTREVVTAALESLSTDEQERLGVWLTQEELDRIVNVERNYALEATSPALQYSDIDEVPRKWFGGTVRYCFVRTPTSNLATMIMSEESVHVDCSTNVRHMPSVLISFCAC